MTLSGTASATTTTNASGAYSFTGLKNGSYTVTAGKSGYTFSPASLSASVNGANVSGVNFTAKAAAVSTHSISGKVTGISAATVTLSGAATATTTTDASGAYTFTALKNGSYAVTASESGYTFSPASTSVSVNTANVTNANFTAKAATYSISGKVTGVSATVTLSGTATATTTSSSLNGTYSFSGLKNGSYTVTASKFGYTFSPASASVPVNGANMSSVNFTGTVAPKTYSISGTVTGSPATVTLSGAAASTTTVSANGTYTFSALKNGSYTITASQSGYTFSPASVAKSVNGANVTGVNFAAKATTATYSISGTVTGAAATVTLSGAASATATVTANGTYTFSGLKNGLYVASASQPGYLFTPSTASATVNSANVTGVNFTAASVPPSVSLSWSASASSNVSGYNVYRGTASGGPYTLVSTSLVAGTTYVDQSVSSGKTYYYTATAVDSSKNQSGYSNQATAAVP